MLRTNETFNTVLGVYSPNRALIRISDRVDLFTEDGRFKSDATYASLGVFIHEYLHYLHNFSTLAGYFHFLNWLQMAFLFTHTVGSDGRSRGSGALTPEQRIELNRLFSVSRALNGDTNSTVPWPKDEAGFRLKEINERTSSIVPRPGAAPLKEVACVIEVPIGGKSVEAKVLFGAHCLLEGVAFETERLIASTADPAFKNLSAPVFPYHIARNLFRFLAAQDVSPIVFIKCAILSLLSLEPGATFVRIAKAFASNVNPEPILNTIEAADRAHRQENLDVILNNDLSALIGGFAQRGKIGAGAKLFDYNFRYYLNRRKKEPLFETTCLEPTFTLEAFSRLLKECAPCPVIQERAPVGAADRRVPIFWFGNFGGELAPLEAEEGLGIFQGFINFVIRHIHSTGFAATFDLPEFQCPYYESCVAPLRQRNAHLCGTMPWLSFDATRIKPETRTVDLCWFGSGIAAARGRSDLG